MNTDQARELSQDVDDAESVVKQRYRPVGDDRYQLELELKRLSNKISRFCANTSIDEISLLSELSHEIDEINAKLKMHIRDLRMRQMSLIE